VGLLVSKIVASAAAADDSASNAAAMTAKLAVENNKLRHQEQLAKLRTACNDGKGNKTACEQAAVLQSSIDWGSIGPIPYNIWVDTFYGSLVSEVVGKPIAVFREDNVNPFSGHMENFNGDKTAEVFINTVTLGLGLIRAPMGVAATELRALAPTEIQYGVAFFGESNLKYYSVESATIGRQGKSFFIMPLEDSAVVRNASDAARYTGRAPSVEAAYLEGGHIYGLSFPTNGLKISIPTAADAGGWPHFLEGGRTAVRLGEGSSAGYLVNPTREFVVPGGKAVPKGSALFKLGPNGEWIPIRIF
jgi:hypothetical protein